MATASAGFAPRNKMELLKKLFGHIDVQDDIGVPAYMHFMFGLNPTERLVERVFDTLCPSGCGDIAAALSNVDRCMQLLCTQDAHLAASTRYQRVTAYRNYIARLFQVEQATSVHPIYLAIKEANKQAADARAQAKRMAATSAEAEFDPFNKKADGHQGGETPAQSAPFEGNSGLQAATLTVAVDANGRHSEELEDNVYLSLKEEVKFDFDRLWHKNQPKDHHFGYYSNGTSSEDELCEADESDVPTSGSDSGGGAHSQNQAEDEYNDSEEDNKDEESRYPTYRSRYTAYERMRNCGHGRRTKEQARRSYVDRRQVATRAARKSLPATHFSPEPTESEGVESEDDEGQTGLDEGDDARDRPPSCIIKAAVRAAVSIADCGSFAAAGVLNHALFPPGRLTVRGVGVIGLPLCAEQGAQLRAACQPAPYGHGEDTVLDPAVRSAYQLDASEVQVDWDIRPVLQEALAQLGVDQTEDVEARLYKLVFYQEGGHFTWHRDTEKEPGMFATLVVQLPAGHEGGHLHVRHSGAVRVFDKLAGLAAAQNFCYLAFYADCEHTLTKLTAGQRCCLIYNVVRSRTSPDATAPQPLAAKLVHRDKVLAAAVELWVEQGKPKELAMSLKHYYTVSNFSVSALKGQDKALVQMLRASGLQVYLALVEQNGSQDPDCRSYRDEDTWEITVLKWIDTRTDKEADYLRTTGFKPRRVLLDGGDLLDDHPDEVGETHYTGNEGASQEVWYRRTCVVFWPAALHVDFVLSMVERRLNNAQFVSPLDSKLGLAAALQALQELPVTRQALQLSGTIRVLEMLTAKLRTQKAYYTAAKKLPVLLGPWSDAVVAMMGLLPWPAMGDTLLALLSALPGMSSAMLGIQLVQAGAAPKGVIQAHLLTIEMQNLPADGVSGLVHTFGWPMVQQCATQLNAACVVQLYNMEAAPADFKAQILTGVLSSSQVKAKTVMQLADGLTWALVEPSAVSLWLPQAQWTQVLKLAVWLNDTHAAAEEACALQQQFLQAHGGGLGSQEKSMRVKLLVQAIKSLGWHGPTKRIVELAMAASAPLTAARLILRLADLVPKQVAADLSAGLVVEEETLSTILQETDHMPTVLRVLLRFPVECRQQLAVLRGMTEGPTPRYRLGLRDMALLLPSLVLTPEVTEFLRPILQLTLDHGFRHGVESNPLSSSLKLNRARADLALSCFKALLKKEEAAWPLLQSFIDAVLAYHSSNPSPLLLLQLLTAAKRYPLIEPIRRLAGTLVHDLEAIPQPNLSFTWCQLPELSKYGTVPGNKVAVLESFLRGPQRRTVVVGFGSISEARYCATFLRRGEGFSATAEATGIGPRSVLTLEKTRSFFELREQTYHDRIKQARILRAHFKLQQCEATDAADHVNAGTAQKCLTVTSEGSSDDAWPGNRADQAQPAYTEGAANSSEKDGTSEMVVDAYDSDATEKDLHFEQLDRLVAETMRSDAASADAMRAEISVDPADADHDSPPRKKFKTSSSAAAVIVID